MVYLPMVILAGGLVANIVIYKCHHRIYKTYEKGRAEKRTYTISRPTRLFRFVKYGLYGAALVYVFLDPLVVNPVQPGSARLLIGALIGASGVMLLYLSLEALAENYAPCDQGLLPYRRVTCGPYRYVNHPMYLANILQLVGAATISFGVLIMGIIIVYSCFIYSIAKEENAALNSHFPHE